MSNGLVFDPKLLIVIEIMISLIVKLKFFFNFLNNFLKGKYTKILENYGFKYF
jgi:hypothetical protein